MIVEKIYLKEIFCKTISWEWNTKGMGKLHLYSNKISKPSDTEKLINQTVIFLVLFNISPKVYLFERDSYSYSINSDVLLLLELFWF